MRAWRAVSPAAYPCAAAAHARVKILHLAASLIGQAFRANTLATGRATRIAYAFEGRLPWARHRREKQGYQ
jgi:hypothetical protein